MNASVHNIDIEVFASPAEANRCLATEIANLIRERQSAATPCILGLATGSTPLGVYRELIRMHREEGLSFANVVTFNLDEYFPIKSDQAQSYVRFMNENLFDHLDIQRDHVHIPDGTIAEASVDAYCLDYERQIARVGGIDLQLLGIGRTGHVGFNEPGSDRQSLTRMVTLNEVTRTDAAKDFSGIDHVPTRAITMGVKTILEAKRIRLLAFGEHKAPIVERTIQGNVSGDVPATFLQNHDDVRFLLDSSAASELNPLIIPQSKASR